MTAPTRQQRTQSFDAAREEPPSTGGASSRAESRNMALEAMRHAATESVDESLEFERAFRALRTPLIAGVDYRAPESPRQLRPRVALADADPMTVERSRIDTLSPSESVPPPAPYPTEPPPARPSVVPPVRQLYLDQKLARPSGESCGAGIHSEPPPRIPISDRPLRSTYSSDPPPRVSRSDPPPQSSHRGRHGQRRSSSDAEYSPAGELADSQDARRREAETLPADARSPSLARAYDPSMRLPALRAPSFPGHPSDFSVRQHENSRLRHVAMAMMFVIFIVTGAIAGMRWYVARDDEERSSDTRADTIEPRIQKVRLDRLEPNALVGPRRASAPTAPQTATVQSVTKSTPARHTDVEASADVDDPLPEQNGATSTVASPWDNRPEAVESASSGDSSTLRKSIRPGTATKPMASKSSASASAARARSKRLDPSKIDTKTPLIMD